MHLLTLENCWRPDRHYCSLVSWTKKFISEFEFPVEYFLTDTIINHVDNEFTESEKKELLNPIWYSVGEFEEDMTHEDLIHESGKPINKEIFISALKKLKLKLNEDETYPYRQKLEFYTTSIDDSINYIESSIQEDIYWFVTFNSMY